MLARIPRRKVPALCAKEKFSVARGHLSPALRMRIENAVEALLAVLDAADPDPDLEPSFGYLPNGAAADECEEDEDRNESEERHHA